jgi:hypothetical protein
MKCHMEYEDGTPYCSNCGGDLVPKEEPKPVQQDTQKGGGTKLDGKLICPKCHLLYEKLTNCIRCGAPLVTQSALKQMQESLPPAAPEGKKAESKIAPPSEAKKEPSPVPSAKKPPVEPKRGEPKQPYAADMLIREPSSMETAEKSPEKELPEDKRRKTLKLEKQKKSFFYSLHGILSIILLLMVAAYFFINHFLTGERVGPQIPSSKKTIESPENSTISKETSPTLPSSALPVVLLPQEIQKLLDLLEDIRQANLKKNIGLLMSCYTSDYADLEERRRTALQSWEKHNYLDLDYVLKVESVSIDSAKARVEWQIRSIPTAGGQLEEGKSVLNVIFRKEKNKWKIKGVTPVK